MKINYIIGTDKVSADIMVKATLKCLCVANYDIPVELYFNEKKITIRAFKTADCIPQVLFHFKCDNIKLWDIFDLNLYFVLIETVDDDLIDRIGFRDIKTERNKILLNGKEIFGL